MCRYDKIFFTACRSDGMADVTDSKSVVGDNVWVQVPPSAPNKSNALMGVVFVCCYSVGLEGRIKQTRLQPYYVERSSTSVVPFGYDAFARPGISCQADLRSRGAQVGRCR